MIHCIMHGLYVSDSSAKLDGLQSLIDKICVCQQGFSALIWLAIWAVSSIIMSTEQKAAWFESDFGVTLELCLYIAMLFTIL